MSLLLLLGLVVLFVYLLPLRGQGRRGKYVPSGAVALVFVALLVLLVLGVLPWNLGHAWGF